MKRTPLTRKTPVRKRNAKRKASEWARAYGSEERVEWVQRQPCAICGYPVCQNCHIGTGGIGRKADADHIAPLCSDHHRELHQHGQQTFEATYGIRLDAVARNTALAYRAFALHRMAQREGADDQREG